MYMVSKSNISWTGLTWNPWWGCEKIAEACTHCYIKRMMGFQGKEPFKGPIKTQEMGKPLAIQRKLGGTDFAVKCFTCSYSDFFHDEADEWRKEAWDIIRQSPNVIFQILTKRP
jgi:protein gp37